MTMSHPYWLSIATAALLLGCRERPANPEARGANKPEQMPAVPSEADVSAVLDSVAQGTAKSASEDHERIQGTWDFVTLTTGPRDSIDFSQDKVTFRVRENSVAGTFVLDSTTQPKRIDLSFAGNPDGPVAPQGIYQFQKDLLVICLATTDGFRPTEFKSTEKQNFIMLVRPPADSSGSNGRPLSGPADSKRGTVP
jgi:uncharacterized protein (TIGR03067 family)